MNAILLENFKCFRSFELPIAPLSVLTGFNAGGKSSALQAILLLAQTFRVGADGDRLVLNGPLVSLGRVGDVISRDAGGAPMQLGVRLDGRAYSWAFEVHGDGEDRILRTGDNQQVSKLANQMSQLLRNTVFVGPVRLGLVEAFPNPDGPELPPGDVGQLGEYAPFWLARTGDDVIDPLRACPGDGTITVRGQVDAWLGTLFPNATVNATTLPGVSLHSTRFRMGRSGETRPANTGYGLSYAFPLIVALLSVPKGTIVVIDSPEAHLHPRAQSAMGLFLSQMAAAGIRLFVETHSDHLLSGIRLAVRNGTLSHEELVVNFFRDASNNSGNPEVTTLRIDSSGAMSAWPEGFFDQAERDLASLSGWT